MPPTNLSIVDAQVGERTDFAARDAGNADFAAVPDEVDVQAEIDTRWDKGAEDLVRLFCTRLRRHPTEPFRDAIDMGIDGEERLAQTEEQYDGGGLGSDTRDIHQPLFGRLGGHLVEKVELDAAALFGNMLERLFDARRFLFREA